MTKDLLMKAVKCTDEAAAKWHMHLAAAMGCCDIATPKRQAAFLAQVAHESGGFSRIEEGLKYSAERLLQVFPKYFTLDLAKVYEKKPEMIASRVYANRMGNGNEGTQDGWRFRGRGLIQLTGRDTYASCAQGLGLELVVNPDLLLQPGPAAMSAGWFWGARNLNPLADAGNFEKITKLINGGLNGYADRLERWTRAKAALGVA